MLGYLGFDGFTSTFQDSLFKGYSMSTNNQMLYVNTFSSLVSLFGEPFNPLISDTKTHLPSVPDSKCQMRCIYRTSFQQLQAPCHAGVCLAPSCKRYCLAPQQSWMLTCVHLCLLTFCALCRIDFIRAAVACRELNI